MRASGWTKMIWVALGSIAAGSGGVLAQTGPPALDFYTIAPCRLYDSRDGDGPFVPGEQREFQVATECEIPEDAAAVALNLTAIEPTGTGSFSVFPDSLLPTGTNAVSYTAGITRAASGVYPLSADGLGTISISTDLQAGQVDLAVDVAGFFWDGSDLKSHTGAPPVCKHGTSVQAVDCWEGGLLMSGRAGSGFYLRAYREAKIRIDYRRSDGLSYSGYAFWDGGVAFTFRTAFPFSGTWTWTAVCVDCLGRTLNPASGTVNVGFRRTSPIIYSRGPLSADPSGRFLRHQTGMKFFWLGDTAWAAPMRTFDRIVANSAGTWTTYLTNRTTPPSGFTPPESIPTAGKFSVAQVSLAFHLGAGAYLDCPNADCTNRAKRAAFSTRGTLARVPTARSYWAPEYWRNLDRRVYEANERGLVVGLTGVMDPFGLANDLASDDDLKIFARNLAARMAGFFVVYSVGWDNRVENATYSCGSDSNASSVVNGFVANASLVTKMKTVGTELNIYAPSHLITTHLGGGTPFFGADNYFHDPGASGQNSPLASSYSYFHREPWLDFNLFQSSQCNPERPSVFQHSGTGPGSTCAGFVPENQIDCIMRRARTMPAKFLSLRADDSPLAGPPLVKPVVNGEAHYERTVLTGQPLEPEIAYQSRHAGHVTTISGAFGFSGGVYNVEEWRWPADGMGITGTRAGKSPEQLKYLSIFQEGQVMEWERLRRKELMLRNAGTVEQERSVVAASESNQYIVAYLPERAAQDERNLQLAINQAVYQGFDSCRWSKAWWNPFNGRSTPVVPTDIVRLARTCEPGEPSPCYTFQFNSLACTGAEARPNDRCDWVLLLDDLLACPSASGQTELWSGLDASTGKWGVFAERRSPGGAPFGGAAQVSELTAGVQAAPKIANGVEQGALVVWVAEDSDGEGYGVRARRLNALGLPAGATIQVSDPGQGDQVAPSVAAVGASGYVVTWTSYSAEADQGEVYARYLDRDGNPLGSQFQVNVTSVGGQAHSQVASDPLGNVVVGWESWGQDGDGNGVFARRFDVSRVPSEEFQVYQTGAGWQYLAGLRAHPAGGFEAHWQVYSLHGHDMGTWGQRINASGAPRNGSEFPLAGPEGGLGQ
jgi:Protein of unknown function (DUF4038)